MASLLSLSPEDFPVSQGSNPQPKAEPVSTSPPKIVRPWELSPRKDSKVIASYHGNQFQISMPTPAPSPIGRHMSHDQTSDSPCQDSGYHSNSSSSCDSPSGGSPSPQKNNKKLQRSLDPRAVQLMETWYQQHFDHPYPSPEVIAHIIKNSDITAGQVRKWMANKRVRSYNTLSYNGTIHPKRLTRLQREISARSLARERQLTRERHHPYNPVSPVPRVHTPPVHSVQYTSTPLKAVPTTVVPPMYPGLPLAFYLPPYLSALPTLRM